MNPHRLGSVFLVATILTAAGPAHATIPRTLGPLIDPYSTDAAPFRYTLAEGQTLEGRALIYPLSADWRAQAADAPSLATQLGQPLIYSVAADAVDDHAESVWNYERDGTGDCVFPLPPL